MKKVGTVIRTSTLLTLLNIYDNIDIEVKQKQGKWKCILLKRKRWITKHLNDITNKVQEVTTQRCMTYLQW